MANLTFKIMAKALICSLKKICTSQFQITPNIGIQVTATKMLLYFLSSLTLNQSFNDGGKVTHMDIFFIENKFEHLN